MSDPMNRSNQTPPPPPPPGDPPPKTAGPLIWILVLIALIAIGWYFYAQRNALDAPVEPETPIGEPADIGDGTPPPPASEREQTQPESPGSPSTTSTAPTKRPADPLERVEPDYPPVALRAREEGTVLLRVQVDALGNPTEVEVARSSRSRELDRAARDAVRKWKFSPALENGQSVASVVEVPIDFRMDTQ